MDANLHISRQRIPFRDVSKNSQVWMSHADTILTLPKGSKLIGSTEDVVNAAYKILGEDTYAIQFHPEVYHTTDGKQMLKLFGRYCQCKTELDSRFFYRHGY